MVSTLTAPLDGQVTALVVLPNQQVEQGDPLLRIRSQRVLPADARPARHHRRRGRRPHGARRRRRPDPAPDVFDDLTAYLLGFDLDPAAVRALRPAYRHCAEDCAPDDPDLLAREDAFLDLFADIGALYRPRTEAEALGESDVADQTSTQEYVIEFLRWLDADRAGLPGRLPAPARAGARPLRRRRARGRGPAGSGPPSGCSGRSRGYPSWPTWSPRSWVAGCSTRPAADRGDRGRPGPARAAGPGHPGPPARGDRRRPRRALPLVRRARAQPRGRRDRGRDARPPRRAGRRPDRARPGRPDRAAGLVPAADALAAAERLARGARRTRTPWRTAFRRAVLETYLRRFYRMRDLHGLDFDTRDGLDLSLRPVRARRPARCTSSSATCRWTDLATASRAIARHLAENAGDREVVVDLVAVAPGPPSRGGGDRRGGRRAARASATSAGRCTASTSPSPRSRVRGPSGAAPST